MKNATRFRDWRLPLWGVSLTLIFGLASLGHQEVGGAVALGCAEFTHECVSDLIAVEYCDTLGQSCEQGECEGVSLCAQDHWGHCASFPGCDEAGCVAVICANWE